MISILLVSLASVDKKSRQDGFFFSGHGVIFDSFLVPLGNLGEPGKNEERYSNDFDKKQPYICAVSSDKRI